MLSWIRSRFYGTRENQDRISSVLRQRANRGGFGPGYTTPFDQAPAEPIELDPDVPWELRD